MMRWVRRVTTSIALASSASGSVVAQAIGDGAGGDLARATCAQLLDLPRSAQGELLIWLHGYYAGAAQRSRLDPAMVKPAIDGLQQACERDRALPLIGAEARAILLGEARPVPQASTAPAATRPDPMPAAPASPAPARPTPSR